MIAAVVLLACICIGQFAWIVYLSKALVIAMKLIKDRDAAIDSATVQVRQMVKGMAH